MDSVLDFVAFVPVRHIGEKKSRIILDKVLRICPVRESWVRLGQGNI